MRANKILILNTLLFMNIQTKLVGLAEPYNSIMLLPFDGHGWFANSNQVKLTELISKNNITIAIEVGSWLGSATRFIASKLTLGAKLYAIDTWLGSLDEISQTNDPRVQENKLFHIFLSNVVHAGLTDKIIPIRMNSIEAAKSLNVKADLIYIDASHKEDDVYLDILMWHKKLSPTGIICGDDWDAWPSVKKAVKRAADDLGFKVNGYGNFWWFEK